MDNPQPGDIVYITGNGSQDKVLHAKGLPSGTVGVVVTNEGGTRGVWFPGQINRDSMNNDLNGLWNPHYLGFQRWTGEASDEIKERAVRERLAGAARGNT